MVERTDRLNSLLKEVISEVIRKEVKNPAVTDLLTVTRVSISKDLHVAQVYVSVIGDEATKKSTIKALQQAAGFIAVNSSQRVRMRYFPSLNFKLDDSVDKHMRVEVLLHEIAREQEARKKEENGGEDDVISE